jgi:hypothetical protein
MDFGLRALKVRMIILVSGICDACGDVGRGCIRRKSVTLRALWQLGTQVQFSTTGIAL